MSENNCFDTVKKYIDEIDHFNLLSGGAPKDEYDSESKAISKRLRFDMTAQEIASIIADEFNKNFNEQESPELFIGVAEKIKVALTFCELG